MTAVDPRYLTRLIDYTRCPLADTNDCSYRGWMVRSDGRDLCDEYHCPVHAAAGDADRCDYRWPLLDPNEEDRRNGITHWCRLIPGHFPPHQCACGAQPGDE